MINTDQIVITREPYTTISTNKFHDKRDTHLTFLKIYYGDNG